jgi:hypothetical protein
MSPSLSALAIPFSFLQQLQSENLMDIYPPAKQRQALLRLAEALGSAWTALRREECGSWRIKGERGWIYAVCCGQIYVAAEGDEPRIWVISLAQATTLRRTAMVDAYKAFRNVIKDGKDCCREGSFKPPTSTLANALAFISRSTST